MQLSAQVECAIVALTELARTPRDAVASTAELAEALHIARPFLEKVLLALKRAGFVESKLGQRGGFRLARAPAEIRLADVVRLFGHPIAPTRSVSEFFFRATAVTRHRELVRFFKSIRDFVALRMETTTIADVVNGTSVPPAIYFEHASTSSSKPEPVLQRIDELARYGGVGECGRGLGREEVSMDEKTLRVGATTFELDALGCLKHFQDWQPEFAEAMAEEVGITPPLTEAHKRFISYLRNAVVETGRTPIVHRACRHNGLRLRELEKLFPAGYHRGACKLAGLNYEGRYVPQDVQLNKVYGINARGFLVDAGQWDESFAAMRAEELGMTLTERHWEVIRFLRATHAATGKVATVFEVSRGCGLEDDEFEQLFPRGYHRSALKVAGLALTSG